MTVALLETGGRPVKYARYYLLFLAEGHLNRRRFSAMLGRIALLPVPTGQRMLVKPASKWVFLPGLAKERCARSHAERSNPELCLRGSQTVGGATNGSLFTRC